MPSPYETAERLLAEFFQPTHNLRSISMPNPIPAITEQLKTLSHWAILIEVRKQGAIGIFEPKWIYVRSDTKEQAIEWAMDDVRMDGLEPSRVLQTVQGKPLAN